MDNQQETIKKIDFSETVCEVSNCFDKDIVQFSSITPVISRMIEIDLLFA